MLKLEPGMKVGRLTVGDHVAYPKTHELWEETKKIHRLRGNLHECICDCGKFVLYSYEALSKGKVQSCGCLRREILEEAKRFRMEKDEVKQRGIEINKRLGKAIQAYKNALESRSAYREYWLASAMAELRIAKALKGAHTKRLQRAKNYPKS